MANLDAGFSGGTNSTRYYGRLYYTENSTNIGANTSNISLNLVIASNNGAYSFFGYNNNGSISVNGGGVASGNYTGTVNTSEQSICSWTGDVGHNSDGTLTINISFSISSGYAGSASNNTNWTLTTIPRYANITSFTVTSITDEAFTLSATTDQSASTINFSIDGGATYSGGGSGTSASQTFQNLRSGTTLTCYAHSVNAASGLNAYSGSLTPTTLTQNNFLGLIS